jgi:hypothetical protein
MTTPASNIPVSVDYTSRDYYSLRDALIKRVVDRTGGKWTGNDPSDFGVALVESFAYMGDLVNYYIDRVANESYLGTATQRQNVLNLASMIGYTAGGYTSAIANVTLTTTGGYRGQIGGSQLTGGTARLAIPNDNAFSVGDKVNVSGLARSEYNGTFTITAKPLGPNEIEYVPASFTVTATGNGTTVTYTTSVTHNLLQGEVVTISGFTSGSTGFNLSNKTITGVTATTFTVAGSPSGSSSGSGTVVYADISISSDVGGYVHSIGYASVPAGTQLTAEVTNNNTATQLIFTTLAQASIPFVNDDGSSGTTTVLARHGIDVATLPGNQASTVISPDINGELIGYSSGLPDQAFALLETEVDISTIKIYVENGNSFDTWTAVQHLEDYLGTDKVFKIIIDGEYNIYIQFGDGIGGAIPTAGNRIKASYFVGAGLIGNVPAYSFTSVYDVPGATSTTKSLIMSKVTPSNISAATGGELPETLDSIRHNAPRALRALTRAVTLEDFANLAVSIPQVGKANAVASLPTSVSVYIAPEKSAANLEITPGIDSTGAETSALITLKNSVASYLADKVQIGTTVNVLDPRYTFVYLNIQYSRISSYAQGDVEAAIKAKLLSDYSYENLDFQTTITAQTIENSLRSIEGVSNVYVHDLARVANGGRNTLAGAADEIFVFSTSSTYLTLAPADTGSNLSALQLASGSTLTLTPAFNPSVFTYTAGTSNASVDVTPTGANSGQNISVNNLNTGSGATRTVSLSTGNNLIPITVTAADGVSTSTYIVTVVKS